MDFEQLDKHLASFYDGTINQHDLEKLFDAFLFDCDVRILRPNDAAILIPLALARKDHQSEQAGMMRSHSRPKWVAAAIVFFAIIVGSIAVLEFRQPTQIYISTTDCDNECAEQWLARTIQTAL